MNFVRSAAILKKAKVLIPSAAQTYSKSYRYYCEGAAPAFLSHGKGCRVWDVDGNEFIDMNCALGAVTVGYNDSRINAAIKEQLGKGISFSQSTELELLLAEKINKHVPCAEMVRFVKNGSDATAAAVRLARAFTGRDIILCCGYHGFQDWYIGTTNNNLGVPKSVRRLTKVFPYNDLAALDRLLRENHNKVAGIIMEPAQLDLPAPGYLDGVKKLAHRNGAVLIFDEVVSGFRFALGGAQEYFKVTPDLSAIGKGMGNGISLSAVVGRREILTLIDEGAFISCTFGGDAVCLAGALATVKVLEGKGVYKHFWSVGNQMKKGLASLVAQKGLTDIVKVSGLGPHSGLEFKDHGKVAALEFASVCQQELVKGHVLSLGINNVSLSHTPKDIETVLREYDRSLDVVADARDRDSIKGILKGKPIRPVFRRNN